MNLVFIFVSVAAFIANAEEEECDAASPTAGSSLLQVHKGSGDSSKTCSYALVGDQDGSQVCEHLLLSDISGAFAALDETGYQQTATLCCHHEMSLFVRREIARQGFDVCDLSDLHGFVHWYDCNDDTSTDRLGGKPKTFAEMQAEIAGVMTSNCPWLGHLPNCPVKGENCRAFPECHPEAFPADSQAGSSAPLDEAGYEAVGKRCCHTEMEQFVRRLIEQQGFQICEEAALQGFLHWFDCSSDHDVHDHEAVRDHTADDHAHFNDAQSFTKLKEGLIMGRSGLPPLCPWLGGTGETCPPTGHNCPVVEVPEPAAHRRRTACR